MKSFLFPEKMILITACKKEHSFQQEFIKPASFKNLKSEILA